MFQIAAKKINQIHKNRGNKQPIFNINDEQSNSFHKFFE